VTWLNLSRGFQSTSSQSQLLSLSDYGISAKFILIQRYEFWIKVEAGPADRRIFGGESRSVDKSKSANLRSIQCEATGNEETIVLISADSLAG
jgi:hypothetical protein